MLVPGPPPLLLTVDTKSFVEGLRQSRVATRKFAMAQAPLHKCTAPGCRALVRGQSRCEKHATKPTWTRSKASASYQWMYQTPKWKARAAQHKKDNPLCAECERKGRTTAVYCTDHIVPHRGDEQLFFDESNWQSLCRGCHQAKTLRGE